MGNVGTAECATAPSRPVGVVGANPPGSYYRLGVGRRAGQTTTAPGPAPRPTRRRSTRIPYRAGGTPPASGGPTRSRGTQQQHCARQEGPAERSEQTAEVPPAPARRSTAYGA